MAVEKGWPTELSALARLLKNVDDPSAIAGNSLLANASPSPILHLRVRAALLGAVASLDEAGAERIDRNRASRQRAIVARCDLRGEKHAAVARALGICLRHFYRERRAALERLLVVVRQRLAVPLPVSEQPPSRFELDLDHVAMLRLTGQFDAAFREVAKVAQAATRAADSVRAWCYAVELAADVDDGVRAQSYLAEAVRAARNVVDDNDVQPTSVDVEMASAFASWQTLDFAGAARSIECAVSGVRALEPGMDRVRARAVIGILFRGSELACLRGRVREARSRLAEARALLEAMSHRPPDLTAQLFFELGVVYGLVPGGTRRAIEYATEALEGFRAYGSSLGVAAAAGTLCTAYAANGQFDRAIEFGSLALELARSRGCTADVANAALILSQAQTLSGDARRGLALAQFAGEHGQGGLYETRALIAVAEAHVRLGSFGRALDLSKRVASAAAHESWDRYEGVALRIQAEAHFALGDNRSATVCLEDSITHLERHGHPATLARAYRSSAAISGRRDRERLAVDLVKA